MLHLYSKACEYALRALCQLPRLGNPVRFQAAALCELAEIPEPFTRKVFQSLVQAGILKALRGPGGGYEFARPVSEISLLDVVLVIDGEHAFDVCAMGLSMCGRHNPCPLHNAWAPFKIRLVEELRQKTLGDLLEFAARGANSMHKQGAVRICLCQAGVHSCSGQA